MTGERRLARLEGSLSPTQAVLAWLAEAQQYQSLPDYARTLLDVPASSAPLSKITEQVESAVRAALKGQPREVIWTAVRSAVGDAVFLFELVLGLNREARDIARLEGLRASAILYWMTTLLADPLSGDPEARKTDPAHARELQGAWPRWRAVLASLADEVRVEEEARSRLEVRYLEGRTALFADVAADWASLHDQAERLTTIATVIPVAVRGQGASRRRLSSREGGSLEERAAGGAKELADDARLVAYDMLGERERGLAIVERRLRAAPRPD